MSQSCYSSGTLLIPHQHISAISHLVWASNCCRRYLSPFINSVMQITPVWNRIWNEIHKYRCPNVPFHPCPKEENKQNRLNTPFQRVKQFEYDTSMLILDYTTSCPYLLTHSKPVMVLKCQEFGEFDRKFGKQWAHRCVYHFDKRLMIRLSLYTNIYTRISLISISLGLMNGAKSPICWGRLKSYSCQKENHSIGALGDSTRCKHKSISYVLLIVTPPYSFLTKLLVNRDAISQESFKRWK